jgi:thymidine phosphorylase
VRTVAAPWSGFLASVDAEALGRASGDLGAGRKRTGDPIDPAVGIVFLPKVGDAIETGQELGRIHARTEADARACADRVAAAITLSDEVVEPPPLVYGWYGG